MDTRIKPIERPGLVMKLAYLFSKKKFGKVLSPLKVMYVRLPLAFGLFSNKINQLDGKLELNKELAYLIRHHVAQLNICSFCMDIGVAIAMKDQFNEAKFHRLEHYKTDGLYSEEERAALQFAEELTMQKKISDQTFGNGRKYFSERSLIEIAWVVSTEHYYNLMNLAFDIHSDQLCQLRRNGH